MGMSKDYEEAIRMVSDFKTHSIKVLFLLLCSIHPLLQGSTNVRVGSSIFGARSYPAAAPSAAPASASASASASAAASKGVENSGGVVGGGEPTIEGNPSANTQNIAA